MALAGYDYFHRFSHEKLLKWHNPRILSVDTITVKDTLKENMGFWRDWKDAMSS